MNKKKFKKYIWTYFHDGRWWDIDIFAYSKDDAFARFKKLPLAQYVGEVHMTIPVHQRIPLLEKILNSFIQFKNLSTYNDNNKLPEE